MSVIACLHPHCPRPVSRGRYCCGFHYQALTPALRNSLNGIREHNACEISGRIVAYFHSRLIGDHEIERCRGANCRADIVWMATSRGKRIPVNADDIEADDGQFNPNKHIAHFTTCPDADTFRKRK